MVVDYGRGDGYMIHFGRLAGRLETHLTKNGVPCRDADLIIEEISARYVSKFQSPTQRLLGSLLKHDPSSVFVDSAFKAIGKFLPEARKTFGSRTSLLHSIK